MFVEVTNLTDSPGKTPVQVAVYNKTIDPGETLRLPAELIDAKVRSLETSGLVSIGSLPSWYAALKNKRGKSLSAEEQAKRIVSPPPPAKQVSTLALADEVAPVEDEISVRSKRKRNEGGT